MNSSKFIAMIANGWILPGSVFPSNLPSQVFLFFFLQLSDRWEQFPWSERTSDSLWGLHPLYLFEEQLKSIIYKSYKNQITWKALALLLVTYVVKYRYWVISMCGA